MPTEDSGQPVLQFLGISPHRAPCVGVQVETVTERGQFDGDNMFELAHPGRHQIIDDTDSAFTITVEKILDDENAVVDLTFELNFLLVGEHVVEQAGVVRGRVLQCPHRSGLVNRRWHRRPRSQPTQAHGEIGTEGLAAHLDVVDRVGNPVLSLIGEFPQPATDHILDRAAEHATRAHGHGSRGTGPQIGQTAFQRVDGDRNDGGLHRHEFRQPPGARLRGG